MPVPIEIKRREFVWYAKMSNPVETVYVSEIVQYAEMLNSIQPYMNVRFLSYIIHLRRYKMSFY